MILDEIRLTDFRCFYGKTRIRFSEDPDKNVTLIYAESGFDDRSLIISPLFFSVTENK
ncbi:hypothetical protein DFP90_1123 [Aestuariispira insulae]|uniref:Uncharacterized protein n=1 Tax=Aestuariispira insulae TaxID=1461337 RepID=A0A3D9H6C1_9PROT|nr:hypothetical protein DFP90_1123 [Aestuariispira insulae]